MLRFNVCTLYNLSTPLLLLLLLDRYLSSKHFCHNSVHFWDCSNTFLFGIFILVISLFVLYRVIQELILFISKLLFYLSLALSWLAKANLAAFSCNFANLFSYLETFFNVGLMNLPFISLTDMFNSLIYSIKNIMTCKKRCIRLRMTCESQVNLPLLSIHFINRKGQWFILHLKQFKDEHIAS